MKAKQPDPFFDPTKTYTHIVFGYEVKFIGYKKREPIYKVIKPGGHTFIGETFTTNEPQKFFTINKETQAQQTAGKWNVTTIRSNGGGDYPGIMNDKQIITSCSTGTKEEAEANAAYIVKSVNSHEELFKMVIDLKNCIKRLTQDNLTQFERDTEAQWEGEAHELLSRINPNYYPNANEVFN